MNTPKVRKTTPSQQSLQPAQNFNTAIFDTIEDKSGYVDVRTLSPYEFLEQTYYGSEGYRDCKYLTPHARETLWQTRRKRRIMLIALSQ